MTRIAIIAISTIMCGVLGMFYGTHLEFKKSEPEMREGEGAFMYGVAFAVFGAFAGAAISF